MTNKIPNITKVFDQNQCAAMRCKSAPTCFVPGDPWQLPNASVPLCDVHKVPVLMQDVSAVLSSAPEPVQTDNKSLAIEETAKALVAETNAEVSESIELAKALEINTQEDLDFVSELLIDVKKKLNQLVEVEQSVTRPMRDLLEGARELFRPARNKLVLLESLLKGKIADAKAREAENNRRALAELAEAHAAGDAAATEAALAQVRHQTNVEGVSTRVGWTWEVVDPSQIPREYLVVNTIMLNAMCKGSKEPEAVPGIKFVQKNIVTVRSAEARA